MNTGNLQEISDRTIPIHSPLKRDEIQPKYRMFHDEGELQHQEEEARKARKKAVVAVAHGCL